MGIIVEQSLLKNNDCYKINAPMKVKGVMVHSLGVAQPDVNVFLNTWNKPGVTKCVHAFVTPDRIVQTLPWAVKGWHAGSGHSGNVSANNTHIGFEICEPAGHTYQGGTMIGYDTAKNLEYFENVYDNAVVLTAWLCDKFGLDPKEDGVVICHSEGYKRGVASNHADVMHWFPKHGKTMDSFRADVAFQMQLLKIQREEESGMKEVYSKEEINSMLAKMQPRVYQSYEEIPAWAKPVVKKAMETPCVNNPEKRVIMGDGNGKLVLTDDNLRNLQILSNLGLL